MILVNLSMDISKEQENEFIEKLAKKIHGSGFTIAAIFLLDTLKPLSYLGSMMSRMFVSPFLPFFGNDIEYNGEILINIFEKTENVEKLIQLLEQYEKDSKQRD